MAKKRGSRPTRFAALRAFYNSYKAGLMDDAQVNANVQQTGFVVYESELEKFASEFPDVDIVDFTAFVKAHGAHKVAGKKVTGTGKQFSLNTAEKAAQIGVLPDNVVRYIEVVNMGYKWRDELQKLIPLGTVTISIPIRQPKKEKAAA